MQTRPLHTLDPEDWQSLRAQSHAMLDDMLDHIQQLHSLPVWQAPPTTARASLQRGLPRAAGDIASTYHAFHEHILPYVALNSHPRFLGWVQGGGSPVGMLAEILTAGLNINAGGRDQSPVLVERQIALWMRELFSFPDTANGIFVTGTSMANLMAVLIAKTAALGSLTREQGLQQESRQLVAYTSEAAHGCVAQAMDLSGLGKTALRRISLNAAHQMDIAALAAALAQDQAAGLQPFFIAATAGTVDVGAIDDLRAVAAIARQASCWFHVDGAFGALGMMSAEIAPQLEGIQQADSIAFDFHKWGQVQYDAGFLLVRDGQKQLDAFAAPAAYLRREVRGLAAGSPWPCDLGPDLSRGFRALKTWFTLSVYGTDHLGRVMAETCRLAQVLKARIAAIPELELMAPVALNIVCFRYQHTNLADVALDQLNAAIVADIHESGIAVPSVTTVQQRLVIRVAFVNHRTCEADVETLLSAVLRFGAARSHQLRSP